MTLVEAASLYLRNNVEIGNCPEEPLRMAMHTIRDQLQVLGFTDKTVMAGLNHNNHSSSNSVIGGEVGLIEELASFRSQIRTHAIQHLRSDGHTANNQELLKLLLKACDESRTRLSQIGVELFDGNTGSWKLKSPKKK